MYKIYKIINTETGKMYIGMTKRSIKKRLQVHLYEANFKKYNMYLHNAIRKHGSDIFQIYLVEEVENKDLAAERERFWIKTFNTIQPNGYNEHEGGLGGCLNASEELRKKLSDAKKGKPPWNKGLNKSDPRVKVNAENISKAMKGVPKSTEHRRNMSIAQAGNKNALKTIEVEPAWKISL